MTSPRTRLRDEYAAALRETHDETVSLHLAAARSGVPYDAARDIWLATKHLKAAA